MSMKTFAASQLGYVKKTTSSSWAGGAAYQGQYSGGSPRVGVMLFAGLLDVNWAEQAISKIELTLRFAGAGQGRDEKIITAYRGAKSSITGTGQSMIGSLIGSFGTNGTAYNSTRTITFSATSNADAFAGLVAWLQSMTTNALTIYRSETTTGEYTANYLKITAASMDITYEVAGSGGRLDRSEADAGEEITLSITPLESDGTVTHAVEWTFGAESSGRIDLGSALTSAFTFPLDWLTEIPNAESGTAYCRLTTYVDGVERATRAIPITLKVPANIVPDFDMLVIPNGTAGGYWQYLGGAKISVLDPVSYYGATIKSYSITGDEGANGTAAILVTPVFAQPGEHRYTFTVTDSRGRSASVASAIYVNALGSPQITAFSVQRYAAKIDDAGETVYAENLAGGHVWFTVDTSIDLAGGNNTPTAYILYGPAGGKTQRIDIAWPAGSDSYETANDRTILTADIPLNSAYEFRLYVEDEVRSVSWTARVEKSTTVMHLAGTGYGVSIGGFSGGTMEDPRFEVAPEWSSHFPGGIWDAGRRMDRVSQTQPMAITSSNFASYGDGFTPTVSRVGPIVFLDGYLKNTAALDSGFDITLAGAIPDWARPAQRVAVLQQGSGSAIWWMIVYPDGGLRIHRYRTGSTDTAPAAGSQFPLTSSWLAADAFIQTYSVSSTLTRCAIENTAQTAIEGRAYVAKLIPELGTEITAITITMGDMDVSGYYENNLIHIPIVSGDIAITAVAEETPAALIQVTDDGEGNVTASEVIDGSLLHEDTDGAVTVTKYATATARDDGSGNIEIE